MGTKTGPRGFPPPEGTLGFRIWKARHDMNMTQDDIASEAGMHRAQIAAIERGYNITAHFTSVVGIAKALDVSLAYMAGESTEYGVYP